MKYALVIGTMLAFATPAVAESVGVGVGVGPVGAGVTIGTTGERVKERTVIKEREPADKTVIIKEKEKPATSTTVIQR